jgi:hypothetical protein
MKIVHMKTAVQGLTEVKRLQPLPCVQSSCKFPSTLVDDSETNVTGMKDHVAAVQIIRVFSSVLIFQCGRYSRI